MPLFTRSDVLRHNNRRLRAGKTVKNRRRRATVRRKKFRACHCPLLSGGKDARRKSAEPGDRRSPQPLSRKRYRPCGQPISRARGRGGFSYAFLRSCFVFSLARRFFLIIFFFSCFVCSIAIRKTFRHCHRSAWRSRSTSAGERPGRFSSDLHGAGSFRERWTIFADACSRTVPSEDYARFLRNGRTGH